MDHPHQNMVVYWLVCSCGLTSRLRSLTMKKYWFKSGTEISHGWMCFPCKPATFSLLFHWFTAIYQWRQHITESPSNTFIRNRYLGTRTAPLKSSASGLYRVLLSQKFNFLPTLSSDSCSVLYDLQSHGSSPIDLWSHKPKQTCQTSTYFARWISQIWGTPLHWKATVLSSSFLPGTDRIDWYTGERQ